MPCERRVLSKRRGRAAGGDAYLHDCHSVECFLIVCAHETHILSRDTMITPTLVDASTHVPHRPPLHGAPHTHARNTFGTATQVKAIDDAPHLILSSI